MNYNSMWVANLEITMSRKGSMILPIAMVLFFFVGCQDRDGVAELEAMRVQADVEEQNKKMAVEIFVAIDSGDFDRLNELFAEDFSLTVPGLPEPLRKDILFQLIKSHYLAFPDWIHVIENVLADGDMVVVKLNQNGTHEAEYEGIPATGIKATLPAMHLFTVMNGKVVSWFAVEDYLGLYMQLSMELTSKDED